MVEQLQQSGSQYQNSKVVDELAGKIHGLLARQLKVTARNGGYYDILLEQEKQLIRSEVKLGNVDKQIQNYIKRIQELQREVSTLRGSLKLYQGAAEQNELYKGYFKQLKQSTAKKVDFDKILNEQILPKTREFQVNLTELAKNTGRDRSSKQKAAICRYAQELDALSKSKELDWGTLSNSAAVFFTSLEHLNDDDWVQERLGLSSSYQELRTRHEALLSLVSKNVQELLKKDPSSEGWSELKQLIKALESENQAGFETSIVNGWIGLGVIHHNQQTITTDSTAEVNKLRSLVALFQREFTQLSNKYPQLSSSISEPLQQFLQVQINHAIGEGQAMDWIKQVMVRQPQIIHVDNVYRYYSHTDKQSNYYLRILVKALVQQLKRINDNHKIAIQLDEAVLQLLRKQVLDNINVDDIVGAFRSQGRLTQVGVIIDKPTYLTTTQTVGVPLKQQKAVIVSDIAHFAVNLQQGVPYRKQIPFEYSKTEVVQMPTRVQLPYSVPTKVVEQVIKYQQKIQIVQIPIEQTKNIQLIQQNIIHANQQILAPEQIIRQIQVPYHTSQIQTKQIQVQRQIAKNVYKQISKIVRVEQAVPKIYRQTKYQIVDKPVHHVVVQKQIQFVNVEKPLIQRVEVAREVQVVVEKPVYKVDHCDCQKPQTVTVEVEKAVYKEVPKEIIIEKCHFIQPNVEQRIVQVPKLIQVPIFKQVIREQPVYIEKPVPLRTVEQKLVVVDRQIPYFVQHFTPVELVVQKPVIVRDIKHVPVEVEQPVPVYIQKIVPKIVQVFRDRIVQKIVQVPRVEIVQRIVQKIVTIPRIIQKIVTVTQIVEVPVFIQTPVLQIVEVPVERLVTDIQQREKIVQIQKQILKTQTQYQVVQRIEYEQIKKTIEIQPSEYPQMTVQKIVRIIEQKPVQVYIDRLVERVVQIKDIIPVEQRVQIPIEIQVPVEIISHQPIFYKQPIIQIEVQRIQREKVVELISEVIRIQKIQTPILQIEKQIVHIPGETIVVRQPQLHIVQIQKEIIVAANDIEEKPVQHYFDLEKPRVVEQQVYVQPEKEMCYLDKPYAVTIERPVHLKHQEMVVVERPETVLVKTREGLSEQVIKHVEREKLVSERQSYPEPIIVPQYQNQVLFEQLPPKTVEKSVMAIDEKIRTTEVVNTVEIQDTNRRVTTREIQVPVYMQKIVEKILMLPQIVQVEKKVYMVEQINSLIAKQVSLEVHEDEYRAQVKQIKNSVDDVMAILASNKQPNTTDLKKKLGVFIELLKNESRMPKIVETVREVEVDKQRDRPVLVPVFDTAKENVLSVIVHDLIEGIKGLGEEQIKDRFSERVRGLLAADLGMGNIDASVVDGLVSGKVQVQGQWKSWLDNYGGHVPNGQPGNELSQAENTFISGYNSQVTDFAALQASLARSFLAQKQSQEQMQNLRTEYASQIDAQRVRLAERQTQLATQKYYKDYYLNELVRISKLLEQKQFEQVQNMIYSILRIKQQVQNSRLAESILASHAMNQVVSVGDMPSSGNIDRLFSQVSEYESEAHRRSREIEQLRQQNTRLQQQIDDIKLNIPAWSKQGSSNIQIQKNNEQWTQKLTELEQNHYLQINSLRQKLMRRPSENDKQGNTEFVAAYEQLMGRYAAILENQKSAQAERRAQISTSEQTIRQLTKQIQVLKRDLDGQIKKSDNERNRLIEEYQRRLVSTSSNQESQLRRELETLRRKYERSQEESARTTEQYQLKLASTEGVQDRQNRRQIDQAKRATDEVKRTIESNERKYQNEKKRIIDDYESKLVQARNQYEQLERKMKQQQQEADKLKSPSVKKISSPGQNDELGLLREKIRKLEVELDGSKKEIENYQKMRLGQTAVTSITSGFKQSALQGDFMSPQGRYKSGGPKFESVAEGGYNRQSDKGESRSSEIESRRISKSGVRSERERSEQQNRSQSSRMSGGSQITPFKNSMTMRELMDMTKAEDKDQIITLVMIKVIEKIQEQADKGIINSYTPSNIFLSSFNPSNLDSLIVRFGAPITNRKSKTQGLYLAPQVLKGEGTSLKSVVFTLAIIWDQLIHYDIYYKTTDQIQNLAYEYKVRDSTLNPILRNTLFEMMSKEPSKRLQLGEAKRRLSLQRYIVSEGRAGTTTSRISTQSRKNQ